MWYQYSSGKLSLQEWFHVLNGVQWSRAVFLSRKMILPVLIIYGVFIAISIVCPCLQLIIYCIAQLLPFFSRLSGPMNNYQENFGGIMVITQSFLLYCRNYEFRLLFDFRSPFCSFSKARVPLFLWKRNKLGRENSRVSGLLNYLVGHMQHVQSFGCLFPIFSFIAH